MVHLTPIFSIFNRKAMSNMFFSFLLIFGVFLPFSITPVYASFPSSLQAILPVYTTPLIPSLSVEMTHSMLQYIHNFQYPCFSNTEYYGVYPWGSGFNFEYRVILYPKSKSYFMRGNGYTTAQINSFTYRLKEYTQTITYRFNSSGSYLGMSTSTSSVGLTVPMSSFYYMDLPQVLITNYDFNAIPPDTYYNPYTTGAKVTLDASRYTSSTTVLGQGLAVSDANLKKMLDVVQAADPY